VNGHSKENSSVGVKRSSPSQDHDTSASRKKRKEEDSDAKLAALLQAEENSRARSTRGVSKKPTTVRKKPVKKTPAKVKADGDSDVELNSDGEKKGGVRKGGFHVSIFDHYQRSVDQHSRNALLINHRKNTSSQSH
jgi:upstream activation factor subunit UAF30